MNTKRRLDYPISFDYQELKKIYESSIRPLENLYKYNEISNRHLSDAELFGTPLVLMIGPYSTGKSTFINYLNGVEMTKRGLKTGRSSIIGFHRPNLLKLGNWKFRNNIYSEGVALLLYNSI